MLKCKHIAAYPEEYLAMFKAPKDGTGDTLREFVNAIERMAGPSGLTFRDEHDRLKFKGDVLEVLAELFFTRFNSDPALGLTDYIPINIEDDYGIDAKGTNANNDLAVVQIKYRNNPADVVTYADIARTFTSGVLQHRLDPSKSKNVFVFTTAMAVSRQCTNVFDDKLVVVSRNIIKRAIDNNRNFWKQCFEEVQNYVSYHSGDSFAI